MIAPVAGFAEIATSVTAEDVTPVAAVVASVDLEGAAEVIAVAGIMPEAVALDVPVAPETVVEVTADEAEEILFEVFVGAVCVGREDD